MNNIGPLVPLVIIGGRLMALLLTCQVRKTSRREVALLKRLKHPNVIELLEGFYHDGKLCLVFDFVQQTLLDRLKRSPRGLSKDVIRHLIWQLLVALEYLHGQKVILHPQILGVEAQDTRIMATCMLK